MRKFCLFVTLLCLLPLHASTPEQAEAVRERYEKSLELWNLKVERATTAEERQAVGEQPDPRKAAGRMWKVLSADLNEAWTLEYLGWFLRGAANLMSPDQNGVPQPIFSREITRTLDAIEKHHLQSPNLSPVCMGLMAVGDQKATELLNKIEQTNPHDKVTGVAALGLAMLGRQAGDDPAVMKRRLDMLRKAIINSADIEINGVKVADLVKEELYIIHNLTKGVTPPVLKGEDSGGRPMSLDSYKGKVIVLVFWNSGTDGGESVLSWIRALRQDERFTGKPFEVVSVNTDPRATLRQLQADGEVDWPTFSDPKNTLSNEYRVSVWPMTFVIGKDGKLEYSGTTGTFAELTASALLEKPVPTTGE